MIAREAQTVPVALGLVLVFVPIITRVCIHFRLFDSPGPLKTHTRPTPRMGGVAIVIAFVGAILVAVGASETLALHFFAALALVWFTGFIDDLRGLSPHCRLATQAAAGVILWHGGWRLFTASRAPFSLLATSVFVVIVTNALNFLDGADGVAAGVTTLIALAYGIEMIGTDRHLGAAVAWSLMGACAGFTVHNYPPSRLFMGDSGSNVLGFGIAFLGLDFYDARPQPSSLVFVVVLAGLPVVDAGFAVVRRLLSRRSPLKGDRRHIYDLLGARGWNARRVAWTCYAITASLGVVGWTSLRCNAALACLLSVSSLVLLAVALILLGALRADGNRAKTLVVSRILFRADYAGVARMARVPRRLRS